MLKLLLVTALVLAMGITAAWSAPAPSFLGFTGLIFTPTADVQPEKAFNLHFFFLDLDPSDNVYGASFAPVRNFEVGLAKFKPEDSSGDTVVHAKYVFMEETDRRPGLAVGVWDLTDQVDSTAYVVASKVLNRNLGEVMEKQVFNLRGSLGVGGGRLDGLFASLSSDIGDRLTLFGEYDTRNINAGGRFRIIDGLTAHGAVLDVGDSTDVALGVSYGRAF